MDLGIRGRTALVTGGNAGIGEAVALALAAEGVKLAVAARDAARSEAVVRRALESGAPDARAFSLDLADPASIAGMLEKVREAFGEVDIVVLNGGGPRAGRFSDMLPGDWDGAYALILRSMLVLTQALVPAMRERRWGRVVALTSSSVKQPIETLVLSNAFRTGLVAALRTLAGEVARDGVTVNCSRPDASIPNDCARSTMTTSGGCAKPEVRCPSAASRRRKSLLQWSPSFAANRRVT